jgi:general secretion pathway protein J
MRTRVRHAHGGFTLLEIMVALALLGMVVAAMYSTWMAIMRGSKVGLNAAAAVQRSRVAIHTLEDALTAARSFSADDQYYGFSGENGDQASLSFVARLSKTFPRGGKFGDFDVRRVNFSLEQGANGEKDLVLRQNPILMDLDVDEKEHPVVLARNVKEFDLGFSDGKSADWLDEWTQTNQLPKLVKITLRLVGNDSSSATVIQELTRVVALPSITVQPGWQSTGTGTGPVNNGPGVNPQGQTVTP